MLMSVIAFVLTSTLLIVDALTSEPRSASLSYGNEPIHTLILTRHGDSLWNGKYPGCQETFTGWTDVDLSPIGEQEAIRTGQLLTQYTSGVNIDALFTSTLTRAKMTAHHCWWAYYDRLEEQYRQQKHYQYYNQPIGNRQNNINQPYQAPAQFIIDHRLNERHYGSLQGIVKAEAEMGVHGHSPKDVYQWRRSWHAVPPQLEDDDPRRIDELRIFGNICGKDNVPKSESLAMVAENRIKPFVDETLTPMLDNNKTAKGAGGTALVVAHANSLRALIGVICNVEQDPSGRALERLESMKIPTASPLVLMYRKCTERGCYVPVDGALAEEPKNELPVYPLSSLPLLRQQISDQTNTATYSGKNSVVSECNNLLIK